MPANLKDDAGYQQHNLAEHIEEFKRFPGNAEAFAQAVEPGAADVTPRLLPRRTRQSPADLPP